MDVQIASRLANRRREAGLSQEALAAKLGVSRRSEAKTAAQRLRLLPREQ